MSKLPSPPKRTGGAALTIRLPPADMRRLAMVAHAERRTPTQLASAIIRQQLSAQNAVRGLVTVASAPELAGVPVGELIRSDGESDERYAARAALFEAYIAIADGD